MSRWMIVAAISIWAASVLPQTAIAQTSIRVAQSACLDENSDPAACTIWAMHLIQNGQGEEKERGGRMLALTCQAGWANACYRHGIVAGQRIAGVGAADWEERYSLRLACDLEHAQGCFALAQLYRDGDGVDREASTALALASKACDLGARKACTMASSLAPDGRDDSQWREVASINPARTVADQLARAQAIIEGRESGSREDAFWTVIRLMEEKNPDAEWIVAQWLANDGFPPFLQRNEGNAIVLYGNAALKGHVDALIEMGMRYWEGNGVAQDQQLAMEYMSTAGARGSEAAINIWRSMYAEPRRQQMRRDYEAAQRAIEERWAHAENRRAQASYGSWQPSRTMSQPRNAAADAAYAARIDQRDFNNAMRYITGSSSACPSWNAYC